MMNIENNKSQPTLTRAQAHATSTSAKQPRPARRATNGLMAGRFSYHVKGAGALGRSRPYLKIITCQPHDRSIGFRAISAFTNAHIKTKTICTQIKNQSILTFHP